MHLVPVDGADRSPGNAPPAAAPAPAGQPLRQAQPPAPLCPVCGDPVGRRRDGSFFATCFQHK